MNSAVTSEKNPVNKKSNMKDSQDKYILLYNRHSIKVSL